MSMRVRVRGAVLSLLVAASCGGTGGTSPGFEAIEPDHASEVGEVVETLVVDAVDERGPDAHDVTPETAECSLDGQCDDGDPCTQDQCVEGICIRTGIGGCRACAKDADCKDGNGCTQDVCESGKCAYHALPEPCHACSSDKQCDDSNECTKDKCTDAGTCESTCQCAATCASDGDCYTGDLCAPAVCESSKGTGSCHETACVPHPITCDDKDPCTLDTCDGAVGECRHAKIPDCGSCASDGDCTDADLCTIDTCSADTHACVHTPDPCDDGDATTVDGCMPSLGCLHVKKSCAADADCDDGNACTVSTCAAGACVVGPVNCDDHLGCTMDTCDPLKG